MEKQFTTTAEKLLEIQKKIKFLKIKEKEEAERLKSICGEETTSFNGYTYKNIERKGSIKYTLIPELKKINLEQYRSEPTSYWKLSFTEQFDMEVA